MLPELRTRTLVARLLDRRRRRQRGRRRSTTPATGGGTCTGSRWQEFKAQSARSVDTSDPAHGPGAGGPARSRRPHPAEPAEQRGLRRLPDRLLLLPVLRLRGLPARLLVPPAAAGRLHPRPDRPPRGRLHPAAAVHRHRRVRPRRGDLPRGRPVPGRLRDRCRRPRSARTARSPPPRAAAAPAATCTTEAVGIDLCESCREPLRETTRDLLRLHHGPHRAAGPDLLRRGGAPPRRVRARRPPTGSPSTARSRAGSTPPPPTTPATSSASPTATRRRSGSPTSAGAAAPTPTSTAT